MKIYEDHNGQIVHSVEEIDGKPAESGVWYRIDTDYGVQDISFQNGPVPENKVNGFTNEAMLSILIHRTSHLNDKFPCRENAIAITKMQEALMWLEKRTADRIDRGVEGKEEK